jgi:2-polyprenyl-3-methyl-5-hydroxy-6-metoxy-1,4-benzoquinol methylase
MSLWDSFWKDKGSKFEWNQKDILRSKGMKELANKITAHLGVKNLKNLNILELGSGIGTTSLFFGFHGANVTLLDMSEDAKKLAKNYWENYAKHKFIVADLFEFNSGKYDVVSSFGLCEHFQGEKRQAVLQKHLDLLKNKGIAIISVPHKYGLFYRMAKKLAEVAGFWDFGFEAPFSKNELINLANKNNLDYEIMMSGFYSSAYDLFIRKPLKVLKIHARRRFDETSSIFDNLFGSGLLIVLKKK